MGDKWCAQRCVCVFVCLCVCVCVCVCVLCHQQLTRVAICIVSQIHNVIRHVCCYLLPDHLIFSKVWYNGVHLCLRVWCHRQWSVQCLVQSLVVNWKKNVLWVFLFLFLPERTFIFGNVSCSSFPWPFCKHFILPCVRVMLKGVWESWAHFHQFYCMYFIAVVFLKDCVLLCQLSEESLLYLQGLLLLQSFPFYTGVDEVLLIKLWYMSELRSHFHG